MAIFGAGSNWDGFEQKDIFFSSENYIIGWNYNTAKDLFAALIALKAGDILYLKRNAPGSKTIRVKGIGIIKKPLSDSIFDFIYLNRPLDSTALELEVRWIHKEEFNISIPADEGKLTNTRAATFFEEYLPYVQENILLKLFSNIK